MSAYEPEIEEALKRHSLSSYAKLKWAHGPIASLEEKGGEVFYNLKPHFKAWKQDSDGVNHPANPNDYWVQEDFVNPRAENTGYFKKPEDAKVLGVQTRKHMKFPRWVGRLKLPPAGTEGLDYTWMGFETDRDISTSRACFRFDVQNETLSIRVGSAFNSNVQDITDQLPSDYDTAIHEYGIEMTRNLIEWRIDQKVVAFAPNARWFNTSIGIDSPPTPSGTLWLR